MDPAARFAASATRPSLACLAFALLVLCSGAAGRREDPPAPRPPQAPPSKHVLVRGSRVSLDVPAGFVPAKRYPGFERAESAAALMVTEMPGPVAEIRPGWTQERLAKQGMRLLASQEVEVDGRAATLFRVAQAAEQVEYQKWIALFGDEQQTVILLASFPAELAGELSDPLRACVVGAKWDPKLEVDPFAYLPFRIRCAPELKYATSMQKTLVFNRGGKIDPQDPDGPAFLVGPSYRALKVEELEPFSKSRARQLPNVSQMQFAASKAIEIGGLSGWELRATYVDSKLEAPRFLYQVILLDEEGYYILVGQVGSALRERFEPVFVSMAKSFELVPVEPEAAK